MSGYQGPVDKHHIYAGSNRNNSELWGCWVWLRHDLHMLLHDRDKDLDKRLKRECQRAFEEQYDHKQFMDIFGKSYL